MHLLAAVLFLGRLTIPYCPLPVGSALLTGQHGYERVICCKWRNRELFRRKGGVRRDVWKNTDGWTSSTGCTFTVRIRSKAICSSPCLLLVYFMTHFWLYNWTFLAWLVVGAFWPYLMSKTGFNYCWWCTNIIFDTIGLDDSNTKYLFPCSSLTQVISTDKHRSTWPPFSGQTAASVCLCGRPNATSTEHMMRGIPSCTGLDVIPNTGLRNASENNTRLAKWMANSSSRSSKDSTLKTCQQICLRPQVGSSFPDRISSSFFCITDQTKKGSLKYSIV